MNVLFVCTGNLCRSPMGELLAGAYLAGTSVTASSAGTLGLASHVIDPNSALVLEKARIVWNGDADASLPACISPAAIAGFRSRRLTLDIAAGSDLILCFEKRQIEQVVTLCPSCVRRVFLLTRFARICSLCAERGLVTGWTVADRLRSIIDESPLVMPLVQPAGDIADPIGQDLEHFKVVGWQTNQALHEIFSSLAQRKARAIMDPGAARHGCKGTPEHDDAQRRLPAGIGQEPTGTNAN